MQVLRDLLKDHKQLLLLLVSVIGVAYVGHLFAQGLILLGAIYLLYTNKLESFLFFLLFVLVASDNYFLHYAGSAKPFLIILLPLAIFLRKRMLNNASIMKYFFAFFLLNFILLTIADYPFTGFQKSLSYFFLFVAICPLVIDLVRANPERFPIRLLEFQIIIGLLNVIYIALEPSYVFSHGTRFRGIFGNPNGLAMYCFFAITMFWVFKNHFRLVVPRAFNIIYLSLFFGLLLFSGSRASLLSVLIFFVLSKFKRNEFFAGTIITVAAVFFYSDIAGLFQDIIVFLGYGEEFRITGNQAQSLETGSGRLVAWTFAWEKIETAFFFGRGWAFEETWFHLPTIQATLNQLNHQGGAHNVFIIFWMNTGLIGLLLFFGGLIKLIFDAAKNNKLAIPMMFSAFFLGNFEPWLAASLNPYTIQFLLILSILLFIPKKVEEIEPEVVVEE